LRPEGDELVRLPAAGSGNYGKVMMYMHSLRSVARARSARIAALAVPTAVSLALLTGTAALANVALTKISHDIFTDAQAQHQTEVEPDTFAFGSTIVSAFQVGRVFGGGSSDIGWATSTNSGAHWTHGFLPGITGNVGGPFGQASDASVAYDPKHNVWLIASLGLGNTSVSVLVSRSTNGGTKWSKPVTVSGGFNDKTWVVCDDHAASPHFGNCYEEFDNTNAGDSLRMATSTDGGVTWSPPRAPGGNHSGLGGQPVVLPNGHVVVPYEAVSGTISAFRSTDGGTTWGPTQVISTIQHHGVAGNLRESPLPSAAVDAGGTVYVTWGDCRFRAGCSSNDIVLAKSTSETTWAAPVRVPIDATSSTVDHFTPGVDVQPGTTGASAHIGLAYYFYPKASCSAATCQLEAGFISSANGGSTWGAPLQLAGPMKLSWLPNTSLGRMYGDYISTSVLTGGRAFTVLSIATANAGTAFHQAMFIPAGGLPVSGGSRVASAAGAHPGIPWVLHGLPKAQ
jgi:hypothetical protein